MIKKIRVVLPVILILVVLSACQAAGGTDQRHDSLEVLTIGTADNGGTMYPVGSAIAEILSERNSSFKINVSASSGSMMNVRALSSGEIDLGLVSGDVAYAAINGLEEFEEPVEGLRAIAAVYSSSSNWMAPEELGIIYVHDLSDKRIGVGPTDSTTELSARIALQTLGLDKSGITLDNSSLSAGRQMVLEGQLDALHAFIGAPTIALTELSEATPSRLLLFTDAELNAILNQNAFYYRTIIPAGTYQGQTEDVATFGVKCLLCVDASMDDELAYALTETLWETRLPLQTYHESLSAMQQGGFMYEELPVPLHDGAKRFYEDLGLLGAVD